MKIQLASCLFLVSFAVQPLFAVENSFRAGAAKVNITPTSFPVIVNGGVAEKSASAANDALYARALVLEDGKTRLAICVVDTCMMMRELIDDAKALASKATGIPTESMLVCATHTHSAPSAMACLGTRIDAEYARLLIGKIAEVITDAADHIQEARVGWTVVPAWEYTNCRRWIYRPDKMLKDPFGEVSVRANMHPGYENLDTVGPSGPIDPDLSMLSVQAENGKPMALLANFSMHYFGAAPLSSDYFGRFAEGIGIHIGANDRTPFIGIMSQGTSGDSHWMDYSKPKKSINVDQFANGLIQLAAGAYSKIEHRNHATIAIAESTLRVKRRVADEARLDWARKTIASIGERQPKSKEEVWAQEQLYIQAAPERELKLQALRIGDLAITAIPNEVFAITGLKLKAQSPLQTTFNIELANGSDGYIPPPEQHKLGGYTTWAARTAGLVPEAEPQIVEAVLSLLEKVSGLERKALKDDHGPYAEAVLASNPLAYWRLNEFNPPIAYDATNRKQAHYEDGIAMYLPGAQSREDGISDVPERPSTFSGTQINRAPHLAGGRIRATVPELQENYSLEFWFWNGLATDVRPVTSYLVSRGMDGDKSAAGDHLGIGGTLKSEGAGKLFFFNGNVKRERLNGQTRLGLRTWHHVVLTRFGRKIVVYLDGKMEIQGEATSTLPKSPASLFLGGRCDNLFHLEGKFDEAAVYERVLTAEEVAKHYQASARNPKIAVGTNGRSAIQAEGAKATYRSTEIGPLSPIDVSRASSAATDGPPPLSPQDSLQKLHLPSGFSADIVAAEPLLLDPVAFDWDERGRLWVVEMADYPLGMDGNGKPGGRVRVLEDIDADGRYDKSTLFADGLNFPNGILTWRDGVIVSAAPEILFLQDIDGDDKLDKKEVLIHGLAEGNQQLRANGLRWGLDNWVYVAAGSPNAKRFGADLKLTSARLGREVFVGGRDYRFKPDTGELEATNGPTQFGRNRDNRGHWFGTQNSNPLWHYVLPEHYLQRNPHFGAAQTVVQLLTPQNPPVYPASSMEKRFHSFAQSGHYTSACGGVIYRDTQLFDDSEIHAFVCEPFHNLIQHASLTDNGVTFQAKPVLTEGKFDFFASEDRWCRPVMVREGPDGALWIADMYRYMIEHPQFLPPNGKEEMLPHYRRGEDLGRMYRIHRHGMPKYKPVRLDNISTFDLVNVLDSSNGWVRDKAHQVLLWRADKAAIAPLKSLIQHSRNGLARLHALCVLDGLGELSPNIVVQALGDTDPGVRENALRLAESHLTPETLANAIRLEKDQDAKVRMQLAFLMGESKEAIAGDALGRLLVDHENDPMMLAAVMTSATPHIRSIVNAASAAGPPKAQWIEALLPIAIGLHDRDSMATMLAPIFVSHGSRYTPEQIAALANLYAQLSQRNITLDQLRSNADSDRLTQLLQRASLMIEQARRDAMDPSRKELERIEALVLLSRESTTRSEALSMLVEWLAPTHSGEVQIAAVRALSRMASSEVPTAFADAWPTMSPATRQVMLAGWMSREAWAFDLVQRFERKELHTATLDPTNRARLINHESKRVKELASKVFNSAVSSRSKILESYRSALSLPGDIDRGRQVYTKSCAACHQRGSEGRAIGPNMASVVAHSPEKLLGSILDPSADIQPGFNPYNCLLNSGEQIYGLLISESANSVVMLLNDGTKRTVLRSEIELLKGQNISLMPDGLETVIDHQQMADLIAFLRQPIHEDEKKGAEP
jgi:putative membrane-bound dehydrogenase-like protein